jgi:Uma2 family endonuclease
MRRTDVKVTADEYRAMPESGPRYQLVDGELLPMTPAPSFRHQDLVGELFVRLRTFVQQHGLGKVAVAPVDVYLSDVDVFQPDVLYVSRERYDRIAQDGVRGAPDLVVEVLSPSTRHLDLGTKRVTYARHGVLELWVVDPQEQTLTVYDLPKIPAHRTLIRGQMLTSPLLPGFALDIDALFTAVI